MQIFNIKDFERGWIYGNFSPSIIKSSDTEVGYLTFKAYTHPPVHYHKEATEINLIIKGSMFVNGNHLYKGDIFVLYPNETSFVYFTEDTELLVIKTPSLPSDKFYD